jgi:signal transduction histidine kinase
MRNSVLLRLMQVYQRLVVVGGLLLPAAGIGFLIITTDAVRRLPQHGFHEFAITIAVLLSAFVALVAYESYRRDGSEFVRFVALAYLGFTIVYTPHGALTRVADHNMVQFVIFGPVSRLIMSSYLFAGLFHLGGQRQPVSSNGAVLGRNPRWWPHIACFILIAVGLYFATATGSIRTIHVKLIESCALIVSCLAIWRMALLPFRSPLMRFHMLAQFLFAQASLAFILSLPWNALWWFAHAISAAGFITLGYAVTRIYLGTRSLATVYDEIMLHHILDRIVEYSPVGILVVDEQLRHIHCNRTMGTMLGCEGAETETAAALFSRLGLDSAGLIDTTRDSSIFAKSFELEIAGVKRFYEARIAKLNGVGASRGYISILIDTSEAHQAAQVIHKLNASLEHEVAERTAINKELESFSYSVSHDLRSPLRAMEGFSRLLEEDYGPKLDDDGRRYLRTVRENSRKMGKLIDDLLAFSRLGREPIQGHDVDMLRMVTDVLKDLGIENLSNHVKVKVGDMPAAFGDTTPLQQVWVNLLSNAIKFSAKNPQPMVEVHGYRNGMENIYCVKDNGVGFEMKYYDKLFGMFQRLHRGDEFEGTGVGLAIVQRIVSRHGGRVWAESAEGKGASFFFSLPSADVKENEQQLEYNA